MPRLQLQGINLLVICFHKINSDPLKLTEELNIKQTKGFANKIKGAKSLDDSVCRSEFLKISLKEKPTSPQQQISVELYLLDSLVT